MGLSPSHSIAGQIQKSIVAIAFYRTSDRYWSGSATCVPDRYPACPRHGLRGAWLMPWPSLPYADPILPAMCAGTCESRGPFVPRTWWLDQSHFPGIAGTGCQQPRPGVEHQARSNGIRCAGYRTGHTRAGACATFSRDKASFDRVPRKRQRAIRPYRKTCGSSAPAVAS